MNCPPTVLLSCKGGTSRVVGKGFETVNEVDKILT